HEEVGEPADERAKPASAPEVDEELRDERDREVAVEDGPQLDGRSVEQWKYGDRGDGQEDAARPGGEIEALRVARDRVNPLRLHTQPNDNIDPFSLFRDCVLFLRGESAARPPSRGPRRRRRASRLRAPRGRALNPARRGS